MNDLPVFTIDPHEKIAILCTNFIFELETEKKQYKILIPHGFEWNGMSIPRIAWVSVGCPFGPRHVLAGLVHDFLYQKKLYSRKETDEIMRQILIQSGESKYATSKMYWAVRVFGRFFWKNGDKRKTIKRV